MKRSVVTSSTGMNPNPRENMEPTKQTIESSIYIPTGPADRELQWYFTVSESDMRGPSAFVASLARVRGEQGEPRRWTSARRRRMRTGR